MVFKNSSFKMVWQSFQNFIFHTEKLGNTSLMRERSTLRATNKNPSEFSLFGTLPGYLNHTPANELSHYRKKNNSLAHKSLYTTTIWWMKNKIIPAIMSHRWKASVKAFSLNLQQMVPLISGNQSYIMVYILHFLYQLLSTFSCSALKVKHQS